MRILFITTHNLATNPRLYKEVLLAKEAGYSVEILCFEFNNWSKKNNDFLIQQLGEIKVNRLDADRTKFGSWLWSVILEKAFRCFGRLVPLTAASLSQAVSRRSVLLTRAIQGVTRPDIVIGHNPGAMWATFSAAKKFNCRAGFDVEDYHPGEGTDTNLQKITKQLMGKLLPIYNYVSFASPLILNEFEIYNKDNSRAWFSVLNYFPKAQFREPSIVGSGPIKMVWFSQNINVGRGLELILTFVKKNINNVELHLIGNLDKKFYEKELKNISNIFIHLPIQQIELHDKLSNFDIGLALEPAKDLNNDLAISNKLLSYLQAGLFVVASNTSAQTDFLHNWQNHGKCFDYKLNNFGDILLGLIDEIETIRKEKVLRFNNFKNNNWESTSINLLNEWNK